MEKKTLSEVSRKLLGRYIDRITAQPGMEKGDPRKRPYSKREKSAAGLERAFNKSSPYGKMGSNPVKVSATEEVIVVEEIESIDEALIQQHGLTSIHKGKDTFTIVHQGNMGSTVEKHVKPNVDKMLGIGAFNHMKKAGKEDGNPDYQYTMKVPSKHFMSWVHGTNEAVEIDEAHTPPAGMTAKEYAKHEFGRKGTPKLRVGAKVSTMRASGVVKDIYDKKLMSTGKTAKFLKVVDNKGNEHEVRHDHTVRVMEEVEIHESSHIHAPGTKVNIPHKGKMVTGKVVRYDKGAGGYSPAYVVHVSGEYESPLVPAHKVKKVQEEIEQIDEVSKNMLKNRYLSKARDSEQTHRAYSYRYHGYDGEGHTQDHEEDEKDERKAEKREAGIALARSKINKKGTAKVRATESVEQVDEDLATKPHTYWPGRHHVYWKGEKQPFYIQNADAGSGSGGRSRNKYNNYGIQHYDKETGVQKGEFIRIGSIRATKDHAAELAAKLSSGKLRVEQTDEQAPVAPTLDRKYLKGTPEHKAYKASKVSKKFRLAYNDGKLSVKEDAEQTDEGILDALKPKAGKRISHLDSKPREGGYPSVKKSIRGWTSKNSKGQARSFAPHEKELARKYTQEETDRNQRLRDALAKIKNDFSSPPAGHKEAEPKKPTPAPKPKTGGGMPYYPDSRGGRRYMGDSVEMDGEQIDELSKDTLASYNRKAWDDRQANQHKTAELSKKPLLYRGKTYTKDERDDAEKTHRELQKLSRRHGTRTKGIETSEKKWMAKEEVEQIDEMDGPERSAAGHGNHDPYDYKKGKWAAAKMIPAKEFSKKAGIDASKIFKDILDKKKIKEEVEQIDEISKGTLRRYIDDAGDQESDIRYTLKRTASSKHLSPSTRDELKKLSDRRKAGIRLASDKRGYYKGSDAKANFTHGDAKVPATEQVELNNQMDEGSFGMETAVAAGRKERIQRRIRDRQVIHHQNVDVHKASLPLSKKFRITK